MCGINGIFAYHYAANPIDRAELARMRDHMAARGPDGKGEWISSDCRVGFGHRRLSIIDLSDAGAQPMSSADGALVVTFNGEIYNYRELRLGLEAKGHVFRSNSDTEVLLHLYAEKGEAMVHDLRGMFAFAIWDEERREVFLARDPYGIKPLYYADDGWTFRFASQVKALLAGGVVSKDPEPAGVVGFYLWGSVPEPFTTYQAIRALPAGTTLRVDRIGAHAPSRYHSIAQVYVDAELAGRRRHAPSPAEAQDRVRGALLDSVRHHLVADVPVGAFLSAGVDSGALVGLMRDAGQQDIQTVTIAFEEFRGHHDDEAPLAEKVARQYGTRHSTRVVTRSEFEADLPRLLEAMDQPSIDGINTWFASKAARELGLKVAVSGLGGDELFGGYPSFRDMPKWVRLMGWPSRVPGLGRATRIVGQPVGRWLDYNPKLAGLLEFGGTFAGAYLLRRGLFMPWELSDILDPGLLRLGLRRLDPLRMTKEQLRPEPRSAYGIVSTLESTLYMRNQLLRDTDWASMAHSLEVRVPLVDSVLLQQTSPIATAGLASEGKRLLAGAPARALPGAVMDRPKTGFTTPVEVWMRALPVTAPVPLKLNAQTFATWPWARQWGLRVVAQTAVGNASVVSTPSEMAA
jgi:asparagine synthase (glutamine-hydrolysing)